MSGTGRTHSTHDPLCDSRRDTESGPYLPCSCALGRGLSSERTVIAAVLREHRRKTGIAVPMGETCRCGAWLDGHTHLRDEPRWTDDLAQHQADEIVKALTAPASVQSEATG